MVIVLDKYKKPLGVCSEHRARQLMEQRRACVYRYFPFAIILKDKDVREMDDLPSFRIKIDPGSKYTGLAVVRDSDNAVVLFMQIEHRGELVVKNMKTRSGAGPGAIAVSGKPAIGGASTSTTICPRTASTRWTLTGRRAGCHRQ